MCSFKPMLATNAPRDLSILRYPLYASPKLDGIRCIVLPGLGAVTRSLKPIPNAYVRQCLSDPRLVGLDGELIVGDATDPRVFNTSTSAIMSQDGAPDFTFHVFDDVSEMEDPFERRLLTGLGTRKGLPGFTKIVPQYRVFGPDDVARLESMFVSEGYEGLMLKAAHGRYKCGRSTEKEGLLLKVKRFEDLELNVIGVEELFHNDNEAKTNALGLTERSSHKANLRPAGVLGALILKGDSVPETRVGTGFTAGDRERLWQQRSTLLGQKAKIKHQPSGRLDGGPLRFPVFVGMRSSLDL